MQFFARVAAPSNVAISGATLGMTIDGLTINALDKVLLPNQNTANENTLYELTPSGLLVRSAPSLDADTEVVVIEGTGKGRWEYSPTQGKFYLSTATPGATAVAAFGVGTAGNTAGNTGGKAGTWVVAGSGGVTASQQTNSAGQNTLWVQGPPAYTLSEYSPSDMQLATQTTQLAQNSIYFAPFDLQQPLSAYRMNLFASLSYTMSAGNSQGSGGRTVSAAIYQRGTGTNSTRIEQLWSQSIQLVLSASSNTNLTITHPFGISNSAGVVGIIHTDQNATASNYMFSRIAGNRMIPVPISSIMSPGRYWVAVAMSSSSSNASYDVGFSMYGQAVNSNNAFQLMQFVSSATNAGYWGQLPGYGVYSATSGAFPVTVPIVSDTIRNQASAFFPLINFSGYTTATNML